MSWCIFSLFFGLMSGLWLSAQTFQVVHYFSGSSVVYANGQLVLVGDTLYGTTQSGGNAGLGTLFSLAIPSVPPLQITNVLGEPVICWADDGLNRILQTTTDLASGNWTNVGALNWTNWLAGASQIGCCVTNAPAGPATFFRLR